MTDHDRIADIGTAAPAAVSIVSALGGIAAVNEWLQAGAFIVAIVSGLCAAYYYIQKSRDR